MLNVFCLHESFPYMYRLYRLFKKNVDWTDFYVQIILIRFHHKVLATLHVGNIQQFEALLKFPTTTCFFEIKNRHF